MGMLDRFEKGIEGAVNRAFAKAFKSEVQPVEIASALRKEIDDRAAVVGRDRVLVPNTFVVELGAEDHARLGEWSDALSDELVAEIRQHAVAQRYTFLGPVTVGFDQAEDLETGVFRVVSGTTRGEPDVSSADRHQAGAAPADPPAGHYADPFGAPADPYGGYPDPLDTPRSSAALAPGQPDDPFAFFGGAHAAADPYAPEEHWHSPGPEADEGYAVLEFDGHTLPLTQAVTVIGRSSEADLTLDDPGISRRHAEIHVLDGNPRIVDLGSTNGTYVDGARVHATGLADGSVITVGRTRLVLRLGRR